jgi:hypothetical protein
MRTNEEICLDYSCSFVPFVAISLRLRASAVRILVEKDLRKYLMVYIQGFIELTDARGLNRIRIMTLGDFDDPATLLAHRGDTEFRGYAFR